MIVSLVRAFAAGQTAFPAAQRNQRFPALMIFP
jgi:hypothetical protein